MTQANTPEVSPPGARRPQVSQRSGRAATFMVWKFEGPEWSSKSRRYVTRRFWCCKVDGKTFEGFGTRSEAKGFAERISNPEINEGAR